MSEARFIVGDVFAEMAKLPDASVDLIVTSPPFLALRSYLPADHPDKGKEIGSEATPADFLTTLLALTVEWRRVLAPHGSLCVELGDTYAGSGNGPDALKAGRNGSHDLWLDESVPKRAGPGWPLDKSLCLLPTLYPASLAYGHNLLTGQPCEPWRIRNQIVWHRPNPPVGALGDKVRPSTSYVTVACTSRTRWFDLDSERGERLKPSVRAPEPKALAAEALGHHGKGIPATGDWHANGGAPPLDAWFDTTTDDVWTLPTQPYSGKIVTVRRVPCGPDDGGERTASPGCPRHGDLPGQVPKALRDERAAARQVAQPRISHNGSHPDPEQLDGFAPTDENRDREGSSRVPTSVPLGPECGPAATPRDMGSSRTDLARSTSQPDTPSARTTAGTARTSASPESSAQGDCTDASSTTSGDLAANRGHQMPGDIADTPPSESPCSCSFHKVVKESTSHYATFPITLPRKLINLMCPRQVCTICGEPRRRIVDKQQFVLSGCHSSTFAKDPTVGRLIPKADYRGNTKGRRQSNDDSTRAAIDGDNQGFVSKTTTLGWSDCGHNTWRRGIVLDPFCGSGTTLVAASELGRDSIGIDLDHRNLDLARQRCGMFLIEEDKVPT